MSQPAQSPMFFNGFYAAWENLESDHRIKRLSEHQGTIIKGEITQGWWTERECWPFRFETLAQP
jgi:hypothetical protein